MHDSYPSSRMLVRATALIALCFTSHLVHAVGPLNEPEASYLKENDVAMTKMMDAMSIKPTGDIDRDFAAMMIPHHQGAIDMARSELKYGKNEQLRRIAQEIVVEQQQEIVAMHVALGESLPAQPSSTAQANVISSTSSHHPISTDSMSMHMHDSAKAANKEDTP